ncbi:hypothetical protein [Ekhidna sp. To15]
MENYEEEFDDHHSDFDDRIEPDEHYFFESKDESEPLRDDDLYYRPLEEY